MAWKSTQTAVGAAAAILVTPSSDASPQYPQKVYIWNRHATQDLFLGGSDVTVANGFQLKAGDTKEFIFDSQDALYAIGSGAATTTHTLRNRV